MKVAIAGANGFVGSSLVPFCRKEGMDVFPLKRNGHAFEEPSCKWDQIDVLINLAGESIFGLWTESKKKAIYDSRIKTTEFLSKIVTEKCKNLKLWINASAIGYYGDRGDQTLDEESTKGSGFLSDVVLAWEKALQPAIDKGIRTVPVRFGVILSEKGGALKMMLPPFKLGFGGKLGDGSQFMSWVTLEDVLGAIYHIIHHEDVRGPVNVVSPHPVQNKQFTELLGKAIKRPTFFTMPTWLIRTVVGEMGEEVFLSSDKVEPEKLLKSGYPFLYPTLENAFERIRVNHGL